MAIYPEELRSFRWMVRLLLVSSLQTKQNEDRFTQAEFGYLS